MHIRKAALLATALAVFAAPTYAQDKNGAAAPAEAPASDEAAAADTGWGNYDEDGNYIWPTQADVTAYFNKAFEKKCEWVVTSSDPELQEPQIYELEYKYSWDDAEAPATPYKLYSFACGGGAYNFSTLYLSVDEYDGIRVVSFAEPSYDVKYVDDNSDGQLDSITVTGFSATDLLVNSDFDPETLQLSSFAKWRGIGDASSTGLYQFHEGRFVLKQYDVDPTYDGEINPVTIVDYTK